jgi:hypothetical protein
MLEGATEMPGFAGKLRKMEAAIASALTRNADPGPYSPDLVVLASPIDAAESRRESGVESIRTRIKNDVEELMRFTWGPQMFVENEGPSRSGDPSNLFEETLASILEKGASDLVQQEGREAVLGQIGHTLTALQRFEIARRTYSFLRRIWLTTGKLPPALLVAGRADRISQLWQLSDAVMQAERDFSLPESTTTPDQTAIQISPNEARAATGHPPNPERSGALPARTDRAVPDESRSRASPTESGNPPFIHADADPLIQNDLFTAAMKDAHAKRRIISDASFRRLVVETLRKPENEITPEEWFEARYKLMAAYGAVEFTPGEGLATLPPMQPLQGTSTVMSKSELPPSLKG